MSGKERLKELLEELPPRPGVYLFRRKGEVLYVGKSASLPDRLRSYLTPSDDRTAQLLSRSDDVQVILTRSEPEALILENTLISRHRPPFNVRLMSRSHYPYIKVTVREQWPALSYTRRLVPDGSLYFGPYSDVKRARRAITELVNLFPVRNCRYPIQSGNVPLCLQYHIGRCPGPCQKEDVTEVYRDNVENLIEFLSGRKERVTKRVEEQMEAASRAERFELAAKLRDALRALRAVHGSPGVAQADTPDRDFVCVEHSGQIAAASLLVWREGRVVGKDAFRLKLPEGREEPLGAFLERYYTTSAAPPQEVVVERVPDETEPLLALLRERTGKRHVLRRPRRDERRLFDLAAENARFELAQALSNLGKRGEHPAMVELASLLGLERRPRRVECVDISHTFGSQPVGSVVVFENGRPLKRLYRKYRVKSDPRGDDYLAVTEVVRRRLSRLEREGGGPPDVMLIDGGKGQLSAALKARNGDEPPMVALAKRNEELYTETGEIIVLPSGSPLLRTLMQLRDEAHRFAVSYHRDRRSVRLTESSIDSLPGIGPVRAGALLRYFGSFRQVRGAGVEELAKVEGIGANTARRLYEALH